MTAGLLFVWLNSALSLLSIRVARRLLHGADAASLLLGALVSFVALGDLGLLLLDAVGALAPLPLALVLTLLVGCEHLLPRGPGLEDRPAAPAPDWPLRILIGLAAGLFLWWAAELVGGGVAFVWDDLAYHAAIPAWWLQAGSLSLPPLTYQAYYPANAELTALWFGLPLGTDTFANLGVFLWLSMLVASFAVIARELDHSPRVTVAALCCLLVSPKLRFFAGTFSANDLAIAGLGGASLALAWTRRGSKPVPRALLCGTAAGLALGTKVSMAPIVLLTGAFLWHRGRRSGERGLLLAFLGGVLVSGSYWYVRNLLLTGNPLFPAALGPFDGPFDRVAQRQTSLVPAILAEGSHLGFWRELLARRLDWPLPLGLTSLAGLVAGGLALARESDRARRSYRLLLVGSAVVFLLLFPLQPFSGTNNRPDSPLIHLARYLTFPFALGLLLLGSRNHERPRVDTLLACAALVAASLSLTTFSWPGSLWIAGGFAAALLLLGTRRARWLRPGRHTPVLLTLAWAGVALLGPTKAQARHEHLLEFGEPRPLGAAWGALEQLPEGARVALLSNLPSSHTLYRPLFGERLQLQPVPVYWDGSPRGPLHESWRARPRAWWWEFEAMSSSLTYPRLAANLARAGVQFLIVSKWPSRIGRGRASEWPTAQRLLEARLPRSRLLFDNDYAALWDVRTLEAPGPERISGAGERE